MKQERNGISLMVLVITIVVIIILAGVVVITLTNNNPIENASKAKFLNNVRSYETELMLYQQQEFSNDLGQYNPSAMQADATSVTYNGQNVPDKTIYDILPSLNSDEVYKDKFIILDGELVYTGVEHREIGWLDDVNVKTSTAEPVVNISEPNINPTKKEVKFTLNFSSNYPLSKINFGNNIKIVDESNVEIVDQPNIVIGQLSGTSSDKIRSVEITIDSSTLGSNMYKLMIKAGAIKNSNDIFNTQNIISSYSFSADNVAPTNPVMSASPTGWTNGNVIVKIEYTDDSAIKEYSLDGATWNQYTSDIEIAESNITVYARATDDVGNQSGQSTLTVANIDKIAPTISAENGGITTSSITINAVASDSGVSGLNTSSYQYSKDNGTTWTDATNETSYTYTGLTTGTYQCVIKVSDNAGNITTSNAASIPTVAVGTITIGASPVGWTNGNVTVTITYPSELVTKQYSLDAGSTWNDYTAPLTVISNSTILAKGIDAGGNQASQASITISNIDKNPPTIAYGTNGASNVQIASTTVTISDTGASGIDNSSLQYVWDTQNTVTPSSGWTIFTNGATITKTDVTGTYYLWIKASDNAGSTVFNKSNAFGIDNTPPANPSLAANPTIWTNGSVTVTITYPGDATTKEYSLDGTTWNAYTAALVVSTNNTTVYARGKDISGNQSGQSTLTVANIDKTIPTVSFGTNGASNIQTASTTVTVSDVGGSALNTGTLQYIWDTQNVTAPGSGWLTFTNGQIISKGLVTGTYYLWIKANDNAGNNVTTKSNAFVIDNTPPANPSMAANPTGWTNGNVTVTVTYSGDTTVKEYSLDGNTWSAYSSAITVTTNNTTIYARGRDATGNQSGQSSITITNIDKTAPSAPTVNLNGYTSGTWTTGNVTQTFSSTDSQSGIQKYQYTVDGGVNWYDCPNPWVISWDGQWNFYIRAVDNAGNISANSSMYTILRDATGPTYSSCSVTNITSDTYDVYLYGVADAGVGVNRVQFPTWTALNGQDDLAASWTTNSIVTGQNLGGGTWKFTVRRSEHNNEYGQYLTHVYIYDNLGNYTSFASSGATLVDTSIAAQFTLTAAQQVFNGTTSYSLPGNVMNNYTIEFDAQPTDTIDSLPENSTSATNINYKHRFIVYEQYNVIPYAGLGISLGSNGIAIIAHSDYYYHILLTYYTNLSAMNHYKIVVENRVPRLYINGTYIKTGYTPTSSYTNVYSAFIIGIGCYGSYRGTANNFVFYNVVK